MQPEGRRWPQTDKVWQRISLMNRVMQRMDVDFTLASRKAEGLALAEARDNCLGCDFDRMCRNWLESGGERTMLADVCPNFSFFKACRAGRA